jgi:nucleoside-diphosphate-sugar epimerase
VRKVPITCGKARKISTLIINNRTQISILHKHQKTKNKMSNNKIVCVTGATGFAASHLIKQLLEKGYTVHTTVRSLSQKERYQFLYNLENAETHLKLFEADLLMDGSFDEAVKNCSVVYHPASPFFLATPKDPQKELVDPAVNGTLNVLNSCSMSQTIKRVVVTSSGAALNQLQLIIHTLKKIGIQLHL